MKLPVKHIEPISSYVSTKLRFVWPSPTVYFPFGALSKSSNHFTIKKKSEGLIDVKKIKINDFVYFFYLSLIGLHKSLENICPKHEYPRFVVLLCSFWRVQINLFALLILKRN